MREVADQPERSAAHRRLQLLRAQSRIARWCRGLLAALDKEHGEFVRPALVRALAAHGVDARRSARVGRRCCARSAAARTSSAAPSSRRSATTRRAYAFDALAAIAKLDGPLQDDAALALGKIGDKRALERWPRCSRPRRRRRSRRSRRRSVCSASTATSHESYLVETLKFADSNPAFRSCCAAPRPASARSRWPADPTAVDALFDGRHPVATIRPRAGRAGAGDRRAAQHAADAVDCSRSIPTATRAIALLAEGFDMLEEDLDKERFFALRAPHLLGVARRLAGPRR